MCSAARHLLKHIVTDGDINMDKMLLSGLLFYPATKPQLAIAKLAMLKLLMQSMHLYDKESKESVWKGLALQKSGRILESIQLQAG